MSDGRPEEPCTFTGCRVPATRFYKYVPGTEAGTRSIMTVLMARCNCHGARHIASTLWAREEITWEEYVVMKVHHE